MTFECNFHIIIHVSGLNIIFSTSTTSTVHESCIDFSSSFEHGEHKMGWHYIGICCIEVKLTHTHTPYSICNEKNLKLKANQTINCHTLVKIVTLFKVLIAFCVAAKCVTCKMHSMQRWKNWVKQKDRQTDRNRMENSNLVESKNEKWIFAAMVLFTCSDALLFFSCGRRIPVKNVWNSVT